MPKKSSNKKDITFLEHVQEIRNRVFFAVLITIAASIAGYFLSTDIIKILSEPLKQTLYYSAPTGELSFVLKISFLFGLVVSSPIWFYQVLAFIKPVMPKQTSFKMIMFLIGTTFLAVCGVLFAYFLSLPFTLEFLMNINKNSGLDGLVQPLISANEYFNFVLAYIAGFAVLFQVPILILIINNIKPLTPRRFFSSSRAVILISFIAAAIITPTPDPINQFIMAAPIVVLYMGSGTVMLATNAVTGRKDNNNKIKANDFSSTQAEITPIYQPQELDVTDNIPDLSEEEPSLTPTHEPSKNTGAFMDLRPRTVARTSDGLSKMAEARRSSNNQRRQFGLDGIHRPEKELNNLAINHIDLQKPRVNALT